MNSAENGSCALNVRVCDIMALVQQIKSQNRRL